LNPDPNPKPCLEVNAISRKVWEQTTGLLQLVASGQNSDGDGVDQDDESSQYFDRVRWPAFYGGLLASPDDGEENESEAEGRLDVDYRGFAAPRLPHTVSIARTILR
jgi:hypothetical protein